MTRPDPLLTDTIARLGAQNVTLAAELQAIADTAREALGEWVNVPLERYGFLYDLVALRTILDLATEALEGQPSAAVSEKETA